MTTVEKITIILRQKRIQQSALCNYLGVSKQEFSEWKSGQNQSYEKYIDKIAEFLGVSADFLLLNEESTEDKTEAFSEIFNKLMETRNISAYQIWKETGIAESTISRWKKGTAMPSQTHLKLLSKYFDVPIDYLVNDKHPANNNDAEKQVYKVARKIMSLNEDDFNVIMRMVDLMVKDCKSK